MGITMARRARQALDRRTAVLRRDAEAFAMPAGGWLRAVREAVGMSAEQLGARLHVSRQNVAALERSELDGGIRLETLRRVAEALDCEVAYALVPRTSLEESVARQARKVAAVEIGRVDQTMLLEAQRLGEEAIDELVSARADELVDSRRLWRMDRDAPTT